MREDFLDPLPELKTPATLIFGRTRQKCFVVDANLEEFVVAIPNAEHYEGDPRLMLVTGDAIHPVHLIRQEAHAGGYSYRLKRLDPSLAPSSNSLLKRLFTKSGSAACVAAGLAVALLLSLEFNSHETLQLAQLQLTGRDLLARFTRSEKDTSPGASHDSTDSSQLAKRERDINKRHVNPANDGDDSAVEMKTVSVSMVSPTSMSAPGLLPASDATVEKPKPGVEHSAGSNRSKKKRTPSLANLLEQGCVGRQRLLTPNLIPWLFDSGAANQLGYLKISDAGLADLQNFEQALHGLPSETSYDSIENLRITLRRSNHIDYAKTVYGFDDIFVIRSNDASIYFRPHKGMVEIVRVLPIDYNRSE